MLVDINGCDLHVMVQSHSSLQQPNATNTISLRLYPGLHSADQQRLANTLITMSGS